MDIAYLVLFLAGIYCGWKLREYEARRVVTLLMQHVQEDSEEDESRIPIRIERDRDVLYAWSTEDGKISEFMAQGTDKTSLENALQKRYPGKRFMASPENLKEVFYDKSV